MRILDKYITKNVALSYIFVLLVFITLYYVIDIFSSLSDVLRTKPPFYTLISYYFCMLPLIFARVSPFSLLISVLYTFAELNKNNEIISIRSSGISILRFSFPVLFFALIVSFLALFIQEKTLMTSQQKVEEIKRRFIKTSYSQITEEVNLAFPSENMIFFARKLSVKDQLLQGVTIFKENDKGAITKKVICNSINYKDGKWTGEDVIEYVLDKNGTIINKPLHWPTMDIPLNETPHELIFKRSIFSQYSPLKTLNREITRLKRINARSLLAGLTIDYHQKMADPFSHFFIVLGILPLALEIKKRKAALSSLGIGFIFGFAYYCITSFSIALGKSGVIIPIFAAWLSPLVFLAIGLSGLLLIK